MPLTSVDLERRQIMAFVRSEPCVVQLRRPRYVDTPAGGRRRELPDEVLPEQIFRLVPFKRRLTREWGLSDEGEKVQNVDWILVGAHDADIQRKDLMLKGDWEYEVSFISNHRLYRTAAGLTVRGERTPE